MKGKIDSARKSTENFIDEGKGEDAKDTISLGYPGCRGREANSLGREERRGGGRQESRKESSRTPGREQGKKTSTHSVLANRRPVGIIKLEKRPEGEGDRRVRARELRGKAAESDTASGCRMVIERPIPQGREADLSWKKESRSKDESLSSSMITPKSVLKRILCKRHVDGQERPR